MLLDQDLRGRVLVQRAREADRLAVGKVGLESVEVVRLDGQVQLRPHELTEHFDLFREREPFGAGEAVERRGEEGHDFEVPSNESVDVGMEDLDRNGGRRHAR